MSIELSVTPVDRKARASALFDRLLVHRDAMIRRIRARGFFRSDVAVDREVGRYLEGTRRYEACLLAIVAAESRTDRAIRDRERRRAIEADRSLAIDRRVAAAMSTPARSADAAMRQHAEFARSIEDY